LFCVVSSLSTPLLPPPRVTVVLPTYRRSHLLERAVRSVQDQTEQAWELLIIDDNGAGHPDQTETATIAQRLGSDARIRYVVHSINRGGAAARNTGIDRARGPFVAFLDDDDQWHHEKLERQLRAFDAGGPDLALVYTRARAVDVHGVETLRPRAVSHGLNDLLRRNTIGSTSTILCAREALRAVGGFDDGLPAKQDVDLYLRLAGSYKMTLVDNVLVTLHLHEGDRIGKNLEALIQAHERFHAKHWHLIDQHPDIAAFRLRSLGRLLVQAGRTREARSVFAAASRWSPPDARTRLLLFMSTLLPRRVVEHIRSFTSSSPRS
jgi:glycosyltransferase involved in cell wall biosynthesis